MMSAVRPVARDNSLPSMSRPVLADLYPGIWDEAPVGSNNPVICADEKAPQLAIHPDRPARPPGTLNPAGPGAG